MPIMFNSIIESAGLSPKDIRLLRHQDQRSERGRSPYDLWRDSRLEFELYQSIQQTARRSYFKSKYWASFVGTPDNKTMFAGLYQATLRGRSEADTPKVTRTGEDKAGTRDLYDCTLENLLSDLIGKLFVEWGPGARNWVHRADKQNKRVMEIRTEFKEEEFPGFLNLIMPLSKVNALLPQSWVGALKSSKGVYLLTCPKSGELYVGSATGDEGFLNRWESHTRNDGQGDSVALKGRTPSDYQVSILEVAGTASSDKEIVAMEQRWKRKLRSREMGLNRN
jgi:GIY-YIG catalytic domain